MSRRGIKLSRLARLWRVGRPDGWIVLARLRAGSATGRVFWDASDLVIMAPAADVAARRFDHCVLLSG
ncbi:hypothetical protein RWK44_34605 [Rhizobium sp. 25PS6]|uniref:hypothetical protein n=1 Tax=Rhizobium sp. 25PS6 TaxID=3075622 RepID=UPI0028FD996B|nr:hypothetical protein [Rhizobium sp. 25PS6]MDU0365495.1 hypothetical protein [Rhizobium sp. 25PS6]